MSKEIYAELVKLSGSAKIFAKEIEYLAEELLGYLLPERAVSESSPQAFTRLFNELQQAIEECAPDSSGAAKTLLSQITKIGVDLQADIEAAYLGDPAAKSHEEVRACYPSVLAVATYRVAHVLEMEGVPYIPRIISEWAHRISGIDIHPGAKIAPGFFVDHGSGVVIGETSVIERGVKLYQGVTLGAKSFPLDADGNPCKGIQRHPKVEEGVVIYANTTILGGDTVIGAGSEIGAGLFITDSIPPNSLVVGLSGGEGRCYQIKEKKSS